MNENINTIFYFPSTLTFEQYQDKLLSQEITPRTIVFAAALNAIYMGGREYGAVVPQSKVVPFVEPYQYDDSNLREQLSALDTALQAANRTAADQYAANQAFMNGIGATIQARIQELLANKDWTDGHLPSGSNFGQQEVESYLQRLGVWGENETHDKAHATWTEIAQTVDAISLSVSQLYDSGELTQGFKQAIVDIAIGDTVKTEIGSYIATNYIEDLDALGNKIIKVLEWLYSGMTSETSANSTFANLYSNAQIGTNSALSKISTAVEKVKDATGNFTGDLVATSNMTAQVNNSLATLSQQAGNNFVKTEIIGKINQTNDDIASIISEITGDNSNTTIANKISTWKSGLVTSATLDGATANLLSSNDSNSLKSGLITFVKNNAAQAELVAANDFTSASVVALVNDAGSSININANKINLNGQTNFTSALADVFTANKFLATSSPQNLNAQFYEIMDADNGFDVGMASSDWDWNKTYGENINSGAWKSKFVHFHNTGLGEIAGGVINWDNSGSNSNTKLNLGSNLGTTTIHAAPKWNKNTNQWFLNHGTINIGTPQDYLLDQLSAPGVGITSENFSSSAAANNYSSYSNCLKAGRTDINMWGNLIMRTGSKISAVFEVDQSDPDYVYNGCTTSIDGHDGLKITDVTGTGVLHKLDPLGYFSLAGGRFNYGGEVGLNSEGGLHAHDTISIISGALCVTGKKADHRRCASDLFSVHAYKDVTAEKEQESWGWHRDATISSKIDGEIGLVQVVSGTMYFAICGGIIIKAGNLAACQTALNSTYAYRYAIKDKTVSSQDSDLGLIGGTLALMAQS